MMSVIYLITKWLTFPGAMFRAIVEHLVCRMCGIPVEDNRVVRNDRRFGHVMHEAAPTAGTAFALCFVPALICSLFASLLVIPASLALFVFQMTGWYMIAVNIVAYWFAFSLFCNCYPLKEDVLNMKEKIYGGENSFLKILFAPGYAFLYVLSYAERSCLTFVCALVSLATFLLIICGVIAA